MIEELQALSSEAKRNIIIVTAILMMIVLLYSWLGFLNGVIDSNSSLSSAVGSQSQITSTGSGFWQSVGNGLGSIAGSFVNALKGVASILQSPGHYVIHPK